MLKLCVSCDYLIECHNNLKLTFSLNKTFNF